MIKYIIKPKFRLRLKDNISNTEADNCKQKLLKLHPDIKAKAKLVKALIVAKEELSRAVKYCQDKNVCGYSAVKTGLFPSIKDARTINKQSDEPISTTKSKRSDCREAYVERHIHECKTNRTWCIDWKYRYFSHLQP